MNLKSDAKVRCNLPCTKKYHIFFIDLLRQSRGNVTEFRKMFSGCRKKLLKNLQNPNPFYSLDLVIY